MIGEDIYSTILILSLLTMAICSLFMTILQCLELIRFNNMFRELMSYFNNLIDKHKHESTDEVTNLIV